MYGAVVFDEVDRAGSGWASVAGGQAFRVRGTGDLPSDVFWWTSLNFQAFQKYGLFKPTLKRDDYIRPDMHQLHKELGLNPELIENSKIAEITSEVFSRIMRMAEESYGITKPTEDTLMEDLQANVVKQDKSIAADVDHALSQAHQSWSVCEIASPTGSKIISFKKPRIHHAQEVLSTPIPSGPWEFIPASDMPAEHKRVDWLINMERPVLAQVSVRQVDPDVSRIIAYASGSTRQRNWMSHPELLCLSKFSTIHIESAFIAKEYAPQPVLKPLELGGTMAALSVSMGILAENYWIALSSSITLNKKSRDQKQTIYSPRAVWISASDRYHMLLSALLLHSSGMTVKAYGRGGVNLAVQRGMVQETKTCALAAGLYGPLSLQEESALQIPNN